MLFSEENGRVDFVNRGIQRCKRFGAVSTKISFWQFQIVFSDLDVKPRMIEIWGILEKELMRRERK